MTEDAVKRAIASAVRQAFVMGRECGAKRGPQDVVLAQATRFAEALILPVAETWVQEGIEQAGLAGRLGLERPQVAP